MGQRLKGKVAVITGTAGGQGRAAAVAFAREGALVLGCDLDSSAGAIQEAQAAGGTMLAVDDCDLTCSVAVDGLIRFALDNYGRVDVLYNNAARATFARFDDMAPELFWKCMSEELNPVLLPCKAVWPFMSAARSGSIINTGSLGASRVLEPLAGLPHATAKAAVIAFTRNLAYEGAKLGIRVNCLSPGVIASPATEKYLAQPGWRESMEGQHMIARLGTVDDVANAAIYLASDESSWVTASNLAIDGGAAAL